MQNEKAHGKNFILEFLSNFWKIILGVLVGVIILSYLGYLGFKPSFDDKYRQYLLYSNYERSLPDESIDSTGLVIKPGERVKAFLYLKNVSGRIMPRFSLELEKFTKGVKFIKSTCQYDPIRPGSIGRSKNFIEFIIDSTYNQSHVWFFGKAVTFKTARLVDEILTRTPQDPIAVIIPVNIAASLGSNYWIGLSACQLDLRALNASPNVRDTLSITLNLFNETGQQRQNVWLKIMSVRIKKFGPGPLPGPPSPVPFDSTDIDSVRIGLMPANGWRGTDPFKFKVDMSPVSTAETICTYFEVAIFENQQERKREIIGAEAILRR